MTEITLGKKSINNLISPLVVQVRCPSCRGNGSFSGATVSSQGVVQDAVFLATLTNPDGRKGNLAFSYGLRVCPNPSCAEPLFVVLDAAGRPIRSYPAERLDFEPTGVPNRILANFEEALSCHANGCFRATAIMVRRTLEEICADRGAGGKDLKQRIAALSEKITVPKELLEAADELRLLGNDAAHLEANLYDEIGREEAEAAIDLAKEILKAVYQLASLVDRLRRLKVPKPE